MIRRRGECDDQGGSLTVVRVRRNITEDLFGGSLSMSNDKRAFDKERISAEELRKVRFEVYGEEMIEKEVKLSGNSGRVYLPPDWVGRKVKIIRIE